MFFLGGGWTDVGELGGEWTGESEGGEDLGGGTCELVCLVSGGGGLSERV